MRAPRALLITAAASLALGGCNVQTVQLGEDNATRAPKVRGPQLAPSVDIDTGSSSEPARQREGAELADHLLERLGTDDELTPGERWILAEEARAIVAGLDPARGDRRPNHPSAPID